MGRIRSLSIRVALTDRGYSVRVAVFDGTPAVIETTEYGELSWREVLQVLDASADARRPGLELLAGGLQHSLF